MNVAFGSSPAEAARIPDARVLHLIGQSDLAISFATQEFRDFLKTDAAYPTAQTLAFALNWNFAVPYALEGRLPDRARWTDTAATSAPDGVPLSFFVHFRLRRAVFAYSGAEADIIAKLGDLLAAHDLGAVILAGAGWSDIIIDGTIPAPRFSEFTHFILKAHELYLPTHAQKLPVFQRTLTILGYSGPEVPTAEGMRHVTFARTLPGSYVQARDMLRREFLPQLYRMFFIEGKSDFMIELSDTESSDAAASALLRMPDTNTDATFFARQKRLLETAGQQGFIQRMESHVLLSEVEKLPAVRDEEVAVWREPRAAEHVECVCAQHRYDWGEYGDAFRALPTGLQQAITNLLFLFAAALKDSTTCCDALPAIQSCEQSLTTLLSSFDRLRKTLPRTSPMTAQQVRQLGLDEQLASLDTQVEAAERLLELYPQGVNVNRELAERYRYFEDWHLYAERVLSQRTVGSFEEMLGQTDKVTTYRGGAQKFLYLADGLVREFTAQIPRVSQDLVFTTLYDSAHTIMGVRGSHFIRIPVRHVFTLPVGIADLWHEVGVAIFNLRYDPAEVTRAAEEIGQNPDEFYESLGDTYGDFIVFLFGFRGNFGRFADSLMKGWRNSRIPGGILVPYEVLTRLYLVLELAYARVLARKKPGQETPPVHVLGLVECLRVLMLRRYPEDRQSLDADKPLTWLTVADRVLRPEFGRYRARIRDFIDVEIPAAERPRLDELLTGRTVEIADDTDVNRLCAEYVAPVIFPGARELQLFKSMAALVKSGCNAYFRRAARRHTTVPTATADASTPSDVPPSS